MPHRKPHPRNEEARAAQLAVTERVTQQRGAVEEKTPKSKATSSGSRYLGGKITKHMEIG
jgi:hypothetical protein